ncbi:unnamed protein product [Rhodiola kirilowii]
MEGTIKPGSSFVLTPHKVSVCILIQIYAPHPQLSHAFLFSSYSQQNRLGSYLLALTKSFDDIFEPMLDELQSQLKEVGGLVNDLLCEQLVDRLESLCSPDDLFDLFSILRGVFGGPDVGGLEDENNYLDPTSSLGVFLRRCILAFNLLSFEGVCHLLTSINLYCEEDPSSSQPYDLPHQGGLSRVLLEHESMDLESSINDEDNQELEAKEIEKCSGGVLFHIHVPIPLSRLIEDIEVPAASNFVGSENLKVASSRVHTFANKITGAGVGGGSRLRTDRQIQGYLAEQADAVEKQGSCIPYNAFESTLEQLHQLAPELHRVHFLHYLNSLFHDDYPAALEKLLCYFDYSAGMEGLDTLPPSSFSSNFGRYEIALLCMGMMHLYFGHPKQALEVLTEAVRVSQQQSNDSCLAYTLSAICSLLTEIGISSTSGILGSTEASAANMCSSVSIQQQLFVLLRRSLKRAETLNLKRLVSSNHVAMAKFHLTHVQSTLLSFGPKAPMQLRTCPANVCKEIRLSSHLISEFGVESSNMMTDGAISTSWLKNLQMPMGSFILTKEDYSAMSSDAVNICAQGIAIPGSVLQLLGSSCLLRATSWELYGSAPLARINTLVFATLYTDASSSADVALAYAKLIQHIAEHKGYKEAFAALMIAEEKFLSISKSRIQIVKLQLLHEQALQRGHLKLAQEVCDEIGVMASSVIGVDMELKVEASIRCARTLLAANQFNQAATVAHSLFCMCYKFNMQVENATVLLLLAEIHKKSGNAVLGLSYALASLSFCQSFNLDLLRASAMLTLSELWLALGTDHAKRALTLLHGALAMIFGHGGLQLCARARIVEAKCILSDPNFSVSKDSEAVLEPLITASEELEVLEYHEMAAEAFHLMAIVYDKLKQLNKREEAAASFRRHIRALEDPSG